MIIDNKEEDTLAHIGIMGMRWGHRKAAGWSPTTAKQHVAKVGKKLAGPSVKTKPRPKGKSKPLSTKPKRITDAQLKSRINRIQMEKQYAQLTAKQISPGKKIVMDLLLNAAKSTASAYIEKTMKERLKLDPASLAAAAKEAAKLAADAVK